MSGTGAVNWMFSKKGYILIDKKEVAEEELMNIALDAGAEDIKQDDKNFEIFTTPADLEKVKQALQAKGVKWQTAELTMLPSSSIKLAGAEAKQVLTLIEALENHDDVQAVYANFDIPDEILEQIASANQ